MGPLNLSPIPSPVCVYLVANECVVAIWGVFGGCVWGVYTGIV